MVEAGRRARRLFELGEQVSLLGVVAGRGPAGRGGAAVHRPQPRLFPGGAHGLCADCAVPFGLPVRRGDSPAHH